MSGDTYEFRAFTRLKQLKYLQRTGQLDDDLYWRPAVKEENVNKSSKQESLKQWLKRYPMLVRIKRGRGWIRGKLNSLQDDRRRWRVYVPIYDKFKLFTMVPRQTYIDNLAIADSLRAVPGCVVECGTWRGGMVAGLAQLLGDGRQYFLFDSFEGLPPAKDVDGDSARAWQADTKGEFYFDNCTAEMSFAREAMRLSGARDVTIVKGWFKDTLPKFTPPSKIALLRLDGDWFESTLTCLECLYSQVSPDGLVILDDYYYWDGCSRAVHFFLARHGYAARITQRFGVCVIPPNFSRRSVSSADPF